MSLNSIKRIVLFIPLILIHSVGFGASIGGYTSDYLDYGVGGRPLAMGGAGRTVVNDASAGYWNPALLADVIDMSAIYMSTKLMGETDYNHLGFSIPFSENDVVAINYVEMKLSDLELHARGVAPSSTPGGIFNVGKSAAMLSYGRKINDDLSVGLTGKYGMRSVYEHKDNVMALDAGVLYDIGNMIFGGNLKNIMAVKGGDETADEYKMDLDLGMSMRFESLLLSVDLARILRGSGMDYHVGAEYDLFSINKIIGIQLRAGLSPNEFTAGVGVNMLPVKFDYAFMARDFSSEHLFSMSLQFDDNAKKIRERKARAWYLKAIESLEYRNIAEAKLNTMKGLHEEPTFLELRNLGHRINNGIGYFNPRITKGMIPRHVALYEDSIYFYMQGKIDKSLENLEYLVQENPFNSYIRELRTIIEGDTKKVFKHKGRDFIKVYIEDALAALMIDNVFEATRLLEKVIYLDPENVLALKRLGSNYYSLQQVEKALKVWKQVIQLRPNDKEIKKIVVELEGIDISKLDKKEETLLKGLRDAYNEANESNKDGANLPYDDSANPDARDKSPNEGPNHHKTKVDKTKPEKERKKEEADLVKPIEE